MKWSRRKVNCYLYHVYLLCRHVTCIDSCMHSHCIKLVCRQCSLSSFKMIARCNLDDVLKLPCTLFYLLSRENKREWTVWNSFYRREMQFQACISQLGGEWSLHESSTDVVDPLHEMSLTYTTACKYCLLMDPSSTTFKFRPNFEIVDHLSVF